MTEEQFRQMCIAHDLTYDYSDDHRSWSAGRASMAAIREAAKLLDPEAVRRIWNEVVDSKLVPGFRAGFYWKG